MAERIGMEPIRFLRGVTSIAAGAQVCIDACAMKNLTIIAGTGATATYSRVDQPDASVHTTGAENQGTVAANTKLVVAVDWPFYLVSSAGGPTRVSVT